MKHKKIAEALDCISDRHINEAAHCKQKRPLFWLSGVAAVLAAAILAGTLLTPPASSRNDPILQEQNNQAPADPTVQTNPPALSQSHLKFLAAAPSYPKLSAYPMDHDANAYDIWRAEQRALHDQPEGYADNLESYFGELISGLLSQSEEENVTCAPVNIYMALAMLAETTAGESRQQLLDLLRAQDMEALRAQAKQVWEGHYNNDGLTTSILANSLWLEDGYPVNEQTVQLVADEYYASVFRSDLGSEEANEALRDWLNEQTGGLLSQQAENMKLTPGSVMALASTVFYQVQWLDNFAEEKNTQDIFYGSNGKVETTYMNRTLSYGPYFWSDNFSAVYLDLEDGGRMWLFLPDEGLSPNQIVNEVTDFLLEDPALYDTRYENKKHIIVNLSVPKFDISASMELSDYIKALGVTDIFTPACADFSSIIPANDGGYVSQIQHAARVAIDEKGVTAAAFTVIDRCGSGMPPEEEIDFTLNRPFLFYIESGDGLPMFTGIVNTP